LTYHATLGFAGLASSHGVQNWPMKTPALLVIPEAGWSPITGSARVSVTFSIPTMSPPTRMVMSPALSGLTDEVRTVLIPGTGDR
jgi:hypothetical protein